MRSPSLKRAYLQHLLFLCIGPVAVLLASLLGAGVFDGFTHDNSGFSWLLTSGLFLLVIVPVFVVIRGIALAVRHKKETQWIWLPIVTLAVSFVIFIATIYLGMFLSTYSDCQLAHENNPVKCGF